MTSATRRRFAFAWAWQRRTLPHESEIWIARLQQFSGPAWSLVQKPGQTRALLAGYPGSRHEGLAWLKALGGSLRKVELRPASGDPKQRTRINARLEILHSPSARPTAPAHLILPHGMAFGSGEHATTFMLLRELAARPSLDKAAVLDLGTGSGILALLARRMTARRVVATDFDPEAIRTARANERLNFRDPQIQWRVADVRRLRARGRYQLVLANLFSGILIAAAPIIATAVAPGGELWLSGILKSQRDEVESAYRKAGLKLIVRKTRGKWVMLRFH